MCCGQRRGPAEGTRHSGTRGRGQSKLDPSVFFGMIANVVKKHPQAKVVATTLREVHSTNRHSWSAVAWVDGKPTLRPRLSWKWWTEWEAETVCGRVYLWPPQRRNSRRSSQVGMAHGALLTTFPGDTTMATVDQVRAFAKGGSARIQR